LRAATLALLLAPLAWVVWLALAADLGPEPLKAGLREIGLWACRLLLVTLAVTPAARILAAPRLAGLRRMIGLGALGYAVLHLVLYAWNEGWALRHIASEILLRFYLTIGFAALLGLVALGWTSTDGWMRQLGRGWKKLHRLVWPIAVLAVCHFFLQSKSLVWEAVIASGVLAWLALWRLLPAERRASPLVLLALAPAAGLVAALCEYLLFALATNLPAERILAANLDLAFGPRPAVWVAIGALAVPALAWVRAGGQTGR
jgi:sulfoxide reductase heme-binding subunit YedZ